MYLLLIPRGFRCAGVVGKLHQHDDDLMLIIRRQLLKQQLGHFQAVFLHLRRITGFSVFQ